MEYEQQMRKSIGESIEHLMIENGYGKDRLQKESGVSKTIIYKILRGQNYEIISLIKIIHTLGASIFIKD